MAWYPTVSQLNAFITPVNYQDFVIYFTADDIRAPPAFLSFDLTYNDKYFCAGTKKQHDEALLYFWYDNLLCCFIYFISIIYLCIHVHVLYFFICNISFPLSNW